MREQHPGWRCPGRTRPPSASRGGPSAQLTDRRRLHARHTLEALSTGSDGSRRAPDDLAGSLGRPQQRRVEEVRGAAVIGEDVDYDGLRFVVIGSQRELRPPPSWPTVW